VTPPATEEAAIAATHSIDRRNLYALASLRFAVGCLFLVFGQYKVFGSQFTLHGGFQMWINRFIQDGAYPFMVPVLKSFVLPNATAIAFLVAYGELAIGLALVLGIWVRAAKCFRSAVHAHAAVLVELSRCARCAVAVFRGFAGPFSAGALLLHLLDLA
jgi:uncharacterized membrane protein YphA (DoxX/SURF4 family)